MKGDGVEEGKKGLVCVVYSGDYPSVGKEEILDRVFVSRSGWPWCRGSERGTLARGGLKMRVGADFSFFLFGHPCVHHHGYSYHPTSIHTPPNRTASTSPSTTPHSPGPSISSLSRRGGCWGMGIGAGLRCWVSRWGVCGLRGRGWGVGAAGVGRKDFGRMFLLVSPGWAC